MLLAALLPLVPLADAAAQAQLFVHPTLVMLSSAQRSTAIHVVNQGDATGVFELSWVDFAMTREGGLVPWESEAPWSLQPHARFSPRRVTLKPGETQLVRLALRPGDDVAEAEYYSHLRVVTLQRDVDAATVGGEVEATRGVRIDARTAIAVPVIWRNSNAPGRAMIESAEYDPVEEQLVVELQRSGELSTRGFLHLASAAAAGEAPGALADPVPLVIYPSVDRRTVTIPLKAAELGANATVEVVYAADAELTSAGSRYATYSFSF